jgi:hypothetical protein
MSATAMASDIRAVASDRARKAKQKGRRDTRMSYLLLAPYLLLLLMFGLFPIAYAFGLSFFDTIEMVFWGVTNYQFVFDDFRVPASVVNVLAFVAIWVTLTMIGVAVLSLMLDSINRKTANTLRTIYFLPGAVTSSAIVVLWLFVLDPSVSPFQPVLHTLGWGTRADVIASIGLAGVFAIMAYFSASGGLDRGVRRSAGEPAHRGDGGGAHRWRQPFPARHPDQAADDLALPGADGNPQLCRRAAAFRRAAADGAGRTAVRAERLVAEPDGVPVTPSGWATSAPRRRSARSWSGPRSSSRW